MGLACAACKARASTAVNDSPGGPIKAFCDAPIATFTPHSSMQNGVAPSDAITSATSKAG
ncbi:hypothetical protein D3C72_2023220 [compost metagenome]